MTRVLIVNRDLGIGNRTTNHESRTTNHKPRTTNHDPRASHDIGKVRYSAETKLFIDTCIFKGKNFCFEFLPTLGWQRQSAFGRLAMVICPVPHNTDTNANFGRRYVTQPATCISAILVLKPSVIYSECTVFLTL